MNQQTNNSLRRNNQSQNQNASRANTGTASAAPSAFVKPLNTLSSIPATGYSGSKVVGIVILAVVLVLLVDACYWLYTVYSNRVFQTTVETEVMPDVKDAASNFSVGNGSIPSSTYSNEYSISMWLNIDNYTYNYGKEKTILRRGDKGSGNPEIVLDAKNNGLIVRLKLQHGGAASNPLVVSSTASVSSFADIPLNLETTASSNAMQFDLARVDTNRIADNSAPLESRHVYHDDYFSQISGNEITPSREVAALKEGFDAVGDLTNACVAVMVDMCKLTQAMQSQANADNQVATMNTTFQSVIDALENTRTTAKTSDDITAVFQNSMSNVVAMMTPTSTFAPLFTNLNGHVVNLKSASANAKASAISIASIQTAVNSKLSSMNCPLTLSGTSDVDITTNVYEALINMVKKSLYTYLNNMGAGLQQAYPDLAGTQNASCLIQNITNPDPTVGTCVYRAIPLQKWVHVVVSVYNQVVDIFIDGQLASSCVLKGYPAISTSDVVITPDGGFSGKISRVIFSNTAMTVQHARELYYAGPVVSSSLWSMIPSWVWSGVIMLIIIGIAYSLFM